MEPQAPQAPAPQDQPVMAPAPEQPVAMAPTPQMDAQPMPMSAPMPAAAPMMASAPASGANPGHGMGIAGLVCAFLAPLVGLILSIVAMKKSKKVGMSNGLALAGIIIGAINTVLGTLFLVMVVASFGAVKDCANQINAASTAGKSGDLSSSVVCE